MRHYFSFGSNMSLARLQERVGGVHCMGRALLAGYVHHFSHHGSDDTGKGNIELVTGGLVVGVLYQLSPQQAQTLAPYEGGYQEIEVEVQLPTGPAHTAYTYLSERRRHGLRPLAEYVAHYYQGMAENDFPSDYVEMIRTQAGHK